jgi:pantoate--beta-alanine ligase
MSGVRTIETVAEMHRVADGMRASGQRIGLVPTMGALHEGHLGLIRQAARASDQVVVSIFVNPVQFGPREDFATYPRDLGRDLEQVSAAGGSLVFTPAADEMYPEGYATYVSVDRLGEYLCGPRRPGHFRGVATVVTKLLAAVKPHVAVFGRKDAQQAGLIQRLVQDLHLDVEILLAPTVREPDGLAMSSRNARLSALQRREAAVLYHALQEAKALARAGKGATGELLATVSRRIEGVSSARLEYAEAVDAEDFQPVQDLSDATVLAVAARFGETRLIDNVVLRPCPPQDPGTTHTP